MDNRTAVRFEKNSTDSPLVNYFSHKGFGNVNILKRTSNDDRRTIGLTKDSRYFMSIHPRLDASPSGEILRRKHERFIILTRGEACDCRSTNGNINAVNYDTKIQRNEKHEKHELAEPAQELGS